MDLKVPGIEHNKFETCQGCPDRTIEPNCHDDCEGYLWRVENKAKINAARREYAACVSSLVEGVERTKASESSKKVLRRKNDR